MSNWALSQRRARLRLAMLVVVHVWVLVFDALAIGALAGMRQMLSCRAHS